MAISSMNDIFKHIKLVESNREKLRSRPFCLLLFEGCQYLTSLESQTNLNSETNMIFGAKFVSRGEFHM